MKPELSRQQMCWGVIGCFGGLFIQLVIGSLYQWGIINIYITSYYKLSDEKVNLEDNAIAFPVMMLCIGLTMRVGLWLSQLTHPLFMMSINVILQAACIFVSSYLSEMGSFIVVYGVLFGLISGLQFMIPIVECNKFLPGRKMYVNGVILIGTGLGSLVFGLFSYNFLNPEKQQPLNGYYYGNETLQDIARKVPECLRFLALLYILIGAAGVLMLCHVCLHNRNHQNKVRKEEQEQMKRKVEQQQKSNIKNQKLAAEKLNATSNQLMEKNKPKLGIEDGFIQFEVYQPPPAQEEEIFQVPPERDEQLHPEKHKREAHSIKQAMCTKVCWVQSAVLFFGSCGVFLVNGNYKTYVKEDITNDELLTIIGVIGSVGNGCSRFFWNLMFNYTGYKTVMTVNLAIQIVVYAVIRFSVVSGAAYLFLVFLVNCCLGGLLVMGPTVAQAIFGQVTGSNIYGFYWTIFALANFLGFAFVAGVADKISFNGIIYICLGMSVLSLIIVNIYTFQGPWKNSTKELRYCINCQEPEEEAQDNPVPRINAANSAPPKNK